MFGYLGSILKFGNSYDLSFETYSEFNDWDVWVQLSPHNKAALLFYNPECIMPQFSSR